MALAPGERHRGHAPPESRDSMQITVNDALAAHRRLVVLGDPGSGKTTLLRYLALLHARDLAEGTSLVRDKLDLKEPGALPIFADRRVEGFRLDSPGRTPLLQARPAPSRAQAKTTAPVPARRFVNPAEHPGLEH
jgi:ABC-type cobalamin/Fe3+-siderophores transport system ATPase subunit